MINKLLKKILNREYLLLKNKIVSRRLLRHGKQALLIIDDVAQELSIEYWLMFGTLLGAVREHGFIKHDDDIDIGMFCKNMDKKLVNLLLNRGFEFQHVKMTSDKRFRMMTFKFHGITFDIYGYLYDSEGDNKITGFQTIPLNGYNWAESHCLNKYRVCLTHIVYEGLRKCEFYDTELSIPSNAEQILSDLYGEDYMIPQKGKKAYKSPIMEILPKERLTAMAINPEMLT